MPHIFTNDFNLKDLNSEFKDDEVEFSLFGKSIRNNTNSIVLTNFREKEFFLEIKKRNNKVLIKSEKTTRPSPNYAVHKAIDTFSKKFDLEVLSSNLNLKESEHISKDSYLKDIEYFKNNLANIDGEIAIEIGFGSGRHLLHRAENSKDITFIGIEIHKPSIEQALKQIKIRNLENLYILDFDARHFLEIFPSNRISTIYVHFPVPWDKKPHRRIIQPIFLKEAKRVLKVDAILELRTDSENYFESSSELFNADKSFEVDLVKNRPIDIESKYESRWLKLEKNIYNFRVKSLENSSKKIFWTIDSEFDIKQKIDIEKLVGETILQEDWFINFKDIYKVDSNQYIISIVAGSYNYPDNRFLLLNKNKIKYLIKKPLELEVNLEIDKYLRELF